MIADVSTNLHVATVLGIDPGLDGAVAALPVFLGSQEIATFETPTMSLKTKRGKKREYDTQAMKAVLKQFDSQTTFVVLEGQQAMPGQGVVSMFRTGLGFGLWLGLVIALDLPHTIVRSRDWQRTMLAGIGGEGKARALLAAGRRFPHVILKRSQHGAADALLLADYGRRMLGGQP